MSAESDHTFFFSAPAEHWGEDVLGRGFVSRSLPLRPDDEGDVCATLVHYLPGVDPGSLPDLPPESGFAVLYIHGWNDYFFQKELARTTAAAGGEFFAIDLRKYGRSLRPGQTFGYVDSLRVYDEDLRAAMNVIRAEVGALPLVLMGHSTGGLTAAMWADRHPGVLAGLVLNAPWLELQTAAMIRDLSRPLIERLATHSPKRLLPLGGGPNHYGTSIAGWVEQDGPVPPELKEWADDPAVTGQWGIIEDWKSARRNETRAGWMNAILEAHAVVARGLNIDCPIFVGASVASGEGEKWDPLMRRMDMVLDVDLIALRAVKLGRKVTLNRYEGKHDLVLSDPDARLDFYTDLYHWYAANLRSPQGTPLATVPRQIQLAP